MLRRKVSNGHNRKAFQINTRLFNIVKLKQRIGFFDLLPKNLNLKRFSFCDILARQHQQYGTVSENLLVTELTLVKDTCQINDF